MESAQDDDIEASELFALPTENLLDIRRKWEGGQSIYRAEWQVIGYTSKWGASRRGKSLNRSVPNPTRCCWRRS